MFQIIDSESLRRTRAVGPLLALALTVVGLLALSRPAAADQNWTHSQSVWRQMDNCTRAAYKQFPDHTAEANQKREAARLKCLRAANLPGEAAPTDRDSVDAARR